MTIDFHDDANRSTYAQRGAGPEWRETIAALVDPQDADVVDLGCGGGTYTLAWRHLGARHVTGVDFSAPILDSARRRLGNEQSTDLLHADATFTGLPARSYDIVFARALVHHLSRPADLADEATRLLRPGGRFIVQDRTIEDVLAPASHEHLRGHFFTAVPRLLEVERARRPADDDLTEAWCAAGFTRIRRTRLWETRRHYCGHADLAADLLGRTGRSLLHALDDHELDRLVGHVLTRVPDQELTERDAWTIWTATAEHARASVSHR